MTSSARPRIKTGKHVDSPRKDTAMTPAPTSGELCSVPAAGLSDHPAQAELANG